MLYVTDPDHYIKKVEFICGLKLYDIMQCLRCKDKDQIAGSGNCTVCGSPLTNFDMDLIGKALSML